MVVNSKVTKMNTDETYCMNCGTKIIGGAIFCHKCGARIESNVSPKSHVQEEQVQKRTGDNYSQDKTGYIQPQQRHKEIDSGKSFTSKTGYIIAGSIGVFLIIGMILTPLVLMSIFGSIRFVYLDTQTFAVDQNANFTSVDFIMKNNLGKIEVEYDSSLDSLLAGQIVVYGKEKANLSKMESIQITNTSNKFILEFDSGNIGNFFMNKDVFSYDINLKINPIALCNFTFKVTTGRINLNLSEGNNLTISNMDLESTTGDISVQSGEIVNSSISGINIQTTTGRAVLNFEDAKELSIHECLTIKTTTGAVRTNLGNETTMNTVSIDITASTGNIHVQYSNLIVTSDIIWNIAVTTGDITVSITQNIIHSQNITQEWVVTTTTGSINIECEFASEIGYIFEANTDTGNISVPSNSDNYEAQSNKFFFELTCTTGNILVNLK